MHELRRGQSGRFGEIQILLTIKMIVVIYAGNIKEQTKCRKMK